MASEGESLDPMTMAALRASPEAARRARQGVSEAPKPDYRSPPEVIALAHALMGGIDLDPASSPAAAPAVGAKVAWGPGLAVADGLEAGAWAGRVFVNPPGGAGWMAGKWWARLAQEYSASRATQAVFVAFSIDALQWSQRARPGGMLAYPTLIPAKRISYLDGVTGKRIPSPPRPSVICWMPPAGMPHGVARGRMVQAAERVGLAGVVVCGGV